MVYRKVSIWDDFEHVKQAIEDGRFDGDAEVGLVLDEICDELSIPFEVARYLYEEAVIELENDEDEE